MSTPRRVLLASILGSGVVFLDGTVVNVALPAIRSSLHGNLADQQWVVEAYLLTLASLLLLGGSLGDLRGRRRVFRFGLAGFGICSLLCALAPSSPLLIGARAAQGIGGALLVPSSLALIMDSYPGAAERSAAIGAWTAWTGVATVIGPLGGGWLIQVSSWRWVFAINLLPVAITLWLLARVPESPRIGCRVDALGGALAALGLAGPVFALIEQPAYGWQSPRVLVGLISGCALLAALLVWERRAPEPMLPLHLFRIRNFAAGNLTTFALYGGLGVATFFLVLFVQQVNGYSPLEAGLALLPITILMFTLSRRWGVLAVRIGPRPLMGFGPIIAGAGLLLERRAGTGGSYLTTILPGVAVFGLGLSMTVAPLTATVLGSVSAGHAGIASGINNAVSRVAGLIAIAAIGAVIAASFQSRLLGSLHAHPLPQPAPAAVTRARARPLVTAAAYAPPADRAQLQRALAGASVGAFRLGMTIAAGLAVLGGLIALAGIAPLSARRAARTAAGTGAPGTDLPPGAAAPPPAVASTPPPP
ncbi:MAG TPA: MFS transporter [Solirubrobacteraceae bacterium]|nr:MFS transporter [Solirubrobacteraceae bacterium]